MLAAKPGSVLRADKQALRAAGDELVRATDRRADAAMMLEVLEDAEARNAGRRYLERFTG